MNTTEGQAKSLSFFVNHIDETVLPFEPSCSASSSEELQQFVTERLFSTWASLQLFFQERTGFPADRLCINDQEIDIRFQTKPTNIGLGLVSLLGLERAGIIDSQKAEKHLCLILDALIKLERVNGFFLDWYDSKTGETLKNWPDDHHQLDLFVSSVDNAWLAAALLVVQQAKPALAKEIQERFLDLMDFESFFDSNTEELWGGYSVLQQRYADFHYPRELLSEPRIVHWVHAALTHGDPIKQAQILERLLDKQGNLPRQLSGGALFELLMPCLFVKEGYLNSVIKEVFSQHCEYGKKELNGMVGVSVADNPHTQKYEEMGIGGRYTSSSIVSAHGAALSFLVDKTIAWSTLLQLEQIPGFYDQCGYRDAADINTHETTNSQVFVNQAMVTLGLLSCRDNYIQELFQRCFDS